MDKKDKQRFGSYIVTLNPDFELMRIMMDEIEAQIEAHKEQIDPETVRTKVCAGDAPGSIYVAWSAKGVWDEDG